MSHSVLKLVRVRIRTKLILNANKDPKEMTGKVAVGSFSWFFRKEAVVGPTNLAEELGSLEEAAFQSLNQKGSFTT